MQLFLQEWYLWIKAFHLIAVISWFAALFYLPRLFVYHTMSEDEISHERFKIMERKLYKGIANPAMMASVILGLLLIYAIPTFFQQGWIHAKLVLVALVIVYHVLCKKHMLALAERRNTKTHTYFRVFNELPVIALILIVILVIVKPF